MWPTFYIPLSRRVEGDPPPRFYLTTPPYPYELHEDMTTVGEVDSITPGISTEEEIESTASFVSAEMVQRLRTTDGGMDEIENAALFVSAEMVQRLLTYNNRWDEIETTAQFVSGEMRDPLVTYLNWPLGAGTEDIITGASFVSGVLA
jgi:tetrahydromethanopterin S-methyltransferase subunit G